MRERRRERERTRERESEGERERERVRDRDRDRERTTFRPTVAENINEYHTKVLKMWVLYHFYHFTRDLFQECKPHTLKSLKSSDINKRSNFRVNKPILDM